MAKAALPAALVFAFVSTCVVNYLVTAGVGVELDNAEIADTHPTYLLPSGWAFSIWGVIYLLFGLFCVYQMLPSKWEDVTISTVRPYALAALVHNCAWLFLFSYSLYWIAWLVIMAYAAVLLKILSLLQINYFTASANLKTKILVAAPFSANAAWVVIASCLQVGVNSIEEGWLASDDFCSAFVVLAVSLAVYIVATRADPVYAFVSAWALGGIINNQSAASTFGCASRICIPACYEHMALCNDPDGRFYALCDGFDAAAVAAGDAEDVCVVPKSEKIRAVCWVGIACVLVTLVVGVARALLVGNQQGNVAKHQELANELGHPVLRSNNPA